MSAGWPTASTKFPFTRASSIRSSFRWYTNRSVSRRDHACVTDSRSSWLRMSTRRSYCSWKRSSMCPCLSRESAVVGRARDVDSPFENDLRPFPAPFQQQLHMLLTAERRTVWANELAVLHHVANLLELVPESVHLGRGELRWSARRSTVSLSVGTFDRVLTAAVERKTETSVSCAGTRLGSSRSRSCCSLSSPR